MKYKFFPQQRDNWCLAACLQSVLHYKTFYEPSQGEIAERLLTAAGGVEGDVSEDILNRFLGNFNLTCSHVNPHEDLNEEAAREVLVKQVSLDGSTDVLVGYDYATLHGLGKENVGKGKHFSLVTHFNPRSERVQLSDPAQKSDNGKSPQVLVDLYGGASLYAATSPRISNGFGFYLVGEKKS